MKNGYKNEKMDEKIDKHISLTEKFQKEVEANNIVGRNMMSMENNMEDRMKIIEDRMENKMKKFEMLMKDAATTGSGYVTSPPRTIQPPTYNGQTSWSWCKKQFEAAATANLWEEEQKSTALVIALRGAALEIRQTLSEEDRNSYSALAAALELRFGDKHLKQVYAVQVKTRTQKVGESLQEFEADVKRLVRLAYSDAPPTFQETLAIETFVNGIRDGEVKKVLQLSRYQTSSEALIRALEVEAAYNSSRTWHKVRVAELETEENDKLEKLLEKLSQQIINGLAQGRENGAPPKKSMECYRCGRQGHLKRDCRARSPAPRRSTQQRSPQRNVQEN